MKTIQMTINSAIAFLSSLTIAPVTKYHGRKSLTNRC